MRYKKGIATELKETLGGFVIDRSFKRDTQRVHTPATLVHLPENAWAQDCAGVDSSHDPGCTAQSLLDLRVTQEHST